MQKKLFTIISTIIITAILVLPLISAYSWGGWYGYRSPLDYLENEWVLFTVLFLIFLAIIFYTLNKALKNPAVAIIIAFGLSLLISMAISQKGLIMGYGISEEFSSWLLFIAALIGIGFLIRFAAESFGGIGAIIAVLGIWLLIHFIDPYQILPDVLLNSGFYNFYEFLKGGLGLIALAIIAFVLSRGTRKTVKDVTEMINEARVKFRR